VVAPYRVTSTPDDGPVAKLVDDIPVKPMRLGCGGSVTHLHGDKECGAIDGDTRHLGNDAGDVVNVIQRVE
jgi:hypothetical protein